MSHLTKHWLLLGAFLVVAIVVSLFPRQTVAPPQEYGRLRVDVLITFTDSVTKQLTPAEGLSVESAGITCPLHVYDELHGFDPPPWFGWCRGSPVNLPVVTDVNGQAVLWFRVSPPPHELGVLQVAPIGERGANFPQVWIGTKHISVTSKPEVLGADHWKIHIALTIRQVEKSFGI